MIRTIGLLSWYAEKPSRLAESIASAAPAIDHLIAVDGAYVLFPGSHPCSPANQAQAIYRECRKHGIKLTLHTPDVPWTEVEKRDFMFRLGHAAAEPGTDWFVIMDADETFHNANVLPPQLEACPADVAEIVLHDPGHGPQRIRKCFRSHPAGIRVIGTHYHYVDGNNRVLWGPGSNGLPALQVEEVAVSHHPQDRSLARQARRDDYYQARTVRGAERILMQWSD